MSTHGLSKEEANDFMALEPRLVEVVRAAVAGMTPAVHVLTAADLADVLESQQKTPAVHVIYGGYQITEDMGTSWLLEHTWYVVAAVRNVADVRTGEAARRDAGVLAARAMRGLAGASVSGTTKSLKLISPPAAHYQGGFQYLPSAVLIETIFHKFIE